MSLKICSNHCLSTEVCTKSPAPFSVFKTNWNVLTFSIAAVPIHFSIIASTSDNVPYQYRCYRQNKFQINKNEVILKS